MLGRGGRRNQGGGGGGGGTYLEVLENLADLDNAATARVNLGFVAQDAGNVLISDGSTTFTSDDNLFFDTTNDRLGIGTNAPSQQLHVQKLSGAAVALIDTQSTSNAALLMMQASRTALANLAANDIASRVATLGRAGGAFVDLAFIDGVYTGDGTTQAGDLVFMTANAGAPAERFRIKGTGELRTQLSAGAAYIDADGDLSSLTTVSSTELGYLDGVTSGIQSQLDTITGAAITSLTTDVVATGPGAAAATIQNNVVTYAKMQDVSATSRILGRKTGGSGDPEECTLSEILDFIGSAAQGDILYRGAATWARLGAGTAGQFLQTGGAGANPSWATVPVQKAGSVSLALNDTTKAIAFNTDFGSTNYAISAIMRNTVDDDPIGAPMRVIAKASTGFTLEWDDLIPSGNYALEWKVTGFYDP